MADVGTGVADGGQACIPSDRGSMSSCGQGQGYRSPKMSYSQMKCGRLVIPDGGVRPSDRPCGAMCLQLKISHLGEPFIFHFISRRSSRVTECHRWNMYVKVSECGQQSRAGRWCVRRDPPGKLSHSCPPAGYYRRDCLQGRHSLCLSADRFRPQNAPWFIAKWNQILAAPQGNHAGNSGTWGCRVNRKWPSNTRILAMMNLCKCYASVGDGGSWSSEDYSTVPARMMRSTRSLQWHLPLTQKRH